MNYLFCLIGLLFYLNIYAEDIPFSSILINESLKEVYILPTDAMLINNLEIDGKDFKKFWREGISYINPNLNIDKINNYKTSDAEKIGFYTNYLSKKLPNFRLDLNWSSHVIKEIKDYYLEDKDITKCPFNINYNSSSLINLSGAIFIFCVSTENSMLKLNKVDLIKFQSNTVYRSYWSRNINDVLSEENAQKILDKALASFQKSFKQKEIEISSDNVIIVLDKKITDKEIIIIENIIKNINSQIFDYLLLPLNVDKNNIKYQTAVNKKQINIFLEKLKIQLSNTKVKNITNNLGMIQLSIGE